MKIQGGNANYYKIKILEYFQGFSFIHSLGNQGFLSFFK